MFFRSFFDESLAQMSYLVGCQQTGEAIVIDPARSIKTYVETARKEGLKIIAVAETHIHADFVSGSREIAQHCDATLYVSAEGGEQWQYNQLKDIDYALLKDGSTFMIGQIEFTVMHTAGHTPESISFVLTDKGGGSSQPMGIFTGDFVFVGDIGRPDLLEKAVGVVGSAELGAIQMFQSLQKFKQLPDYLQVWPGHGAGSACGKALGAVPMSTVGYENLNNWALREEDQEKFIKTLLTGQSIPPNYFAMMKKLNKMGPPLVSREETTKIHTVEQLKNHDTNAVLVDTRKAAEFAKGHLEGTINIPFNQSFTNWAGELIGYDLEIILIAEECKLNAIKESLSSIGLDRIAGFIEPSDVLANDGQLESYGEVDIKQLQEYLLNEQYHLIDVRNESEWAEGRIEGAEHMPLNLLTKQLDDLPKGKTYLVHCKSGARSAIASSLLQAHGYKDVMIVKGGYLAWLKETNKQAPVIK